jgi:hypothetical protein
MLSQESRVGGRYTRTVPEPAMPLRQFPLGWSADSPRQVEEMGLEQAYSQVDRLAFVCYTWSVSFGVTAALHVPKATEL